MLAALSLALVRPFPPPPPLCALGVPYALDPRLVGPLHRILALRAISTIVDMCPVLAHALPPQLRCFVRLCLVAALAVLPAALDL